MISDTIRIAVETQRKRADMLARLRPTLANASKCADNLYSNLEAQRVTAQQQAQTLNLLSQNRPGFYPTPPAIVARMIAEAHIAPGHSVLEPSAGTGNIADAIRQAGCEPVCIELAHDLAEILREKGHNVVWRDFLEHSGTYDRILMNPPFENAQDIVHVRHAYTCLATGGILVTIMSEGPFFRQDRKATDFRAWLNSVSGQSERLPERAFYQSGTGVQTRLVIIHK